ncbi:MAG: orotidine-5'-phosphate decarboxylase [Geminocystis sp.]|nr:orotidine-5'-phosphate decarboxylase [Geminocystis sp.]HIK37580.1 orotidine-5'-phosphate decarboxylase [Geminocystis sp. M7585_C2015_104]MCS7146617.1 orotidine-5'-phosphate decarboxylase [Geminocystis sp.]MCX8077484.1 orotidine-5'-phosphate decarboxylase [Geminocystis sp.]MDW8115443.1 orotidine-5'-phosphate decarboxylase [Geminocystis sp.]
MKSERIIVPLDVPNWEAATKLVEMLPGVTFWKVGLQLFVAEGADILKYLKDKGKKIFLDLKFHDIPNTVRGATLSAVSYQVDLLTIHAVAGREALKAAQEAVKNSAAATKLLAITVLTSLDARQLASDLKIPLPLPEYVLNNALMAKECGLDGVVASPQEVRQIKQACGKEFLTVCPGVRPQWATMEDQKRVMTPTQAFAEGADYLVIGRPITHADNPPLAWERLLAEIADSP